MAVVEQIPGTRTYLEAVKRIVSACGQSEPSVLASPTATVRRAMRAVSDARDQIFYRARWRFRRELYDLVLADGQMWYPLPSDFDDFASGISVDDLTPPLAFMEYEKLLQEYPYIRSFPPGTTVTDMTTITQLSAQTQAFGIPTVYTMWGHDYVGLFLIPDADFVAAQIKLIGSYWRAPIELTSDSDSIDLPRSLWKCHHLLALSDLKESLEFSDWKDDEVMGQALLRHAVAAHKPQQQRDDMQNSAINYNE